MTFASVAAITLLALFGAGIVVAAFNTKRLIAWENRVLSSLADSVREYRLSLEEDSRLLEGAQPLPQKQPARTKSAAQRKGKAA